MISVCMATYNGEKYLREQVDTILAQLSNDDELVVSDDGSTDHTIQILEGYKDPRIKILQNKGPHGVNGNFENVLRHAKGDYIFLSDQDDVWLPNKVDICVEALKNADCVVHDAIVVDFDLNVQNNSFFKMRRSGVGFLKNLYRNSYLGCCMAFRREMLKVILPIPKTRCFFHDNWIGGIIDLKYKLIFIPFKGIKFRRHNDNTSCTAKQSNFSAIRQLYNRLMQFGYTVNRCLH